MLVSRPCFARTGSPANRQKSSLSTLSVPVVDEIGLRWKISRGATVGLLRTINIAPMPATIIIFFVLPSTTDPLHLILFA